MRCEACDGTGRDVSKTQLPGEVPLSHGQCDACDGLGTVPNPPEDAWAEFPDDARMSATALPPSKGPKWARPGGVLDKREYDK
jgi:hypothetical protein